MAAELEVTCTAAPTFRGGDLCPRHFNHKAWPLQISSLVTSHFCKVEEIQHFTRQKQTKKQKIQRLISDHNVVGNTWHAVLLYDIDFCRQTHGTLTFSPRWCTTASSGTWQVVSGQILLSPILCCVSITVCWLFGWLIDQLSCSLLNGGVVCCDWYHDYSKTSLSPPPLSSPNPICGFKAMSGFH